MSGSHSALNLADLSTDWKETVAAPGHAGAPAPGSLDQMLSQVVHEVKNTLGVLLMGSDYLQKKLPAGESNTTRVLADMRNAVTKTDAIVRGLAELSAAEKIDAKAADLHALIEAALTQLTAEFAGKQLQIVRKFAAGVPPLLIDKARLQKAMTHIFRNALEAMSPGGTLTVQTLAVPSGKGPGALAEPTVHIVVRDTGRGVAERFLPRVFEPFFTTDKTGLKSGLGLTVAQKIILAHRGQIAFANGPSGGAQVSVSVGGHREETPLSIQTHPQPSSAL